MVDSVFVVLAFLMGYVTGALAIVLFFFKPNVTEKKKAAKEAANEKHFSYKV